jgi:peptidoglycan/LPS O-acetylase OafA/YrhL
MLCALFYVLAVERRVLSAKRVRQLGLIALVGAIACIALAIPHVDIAGLMVVPGAQWGADVVAYPLLVGLGFGGLVLGILWGGQWIRYLFEAAPIRTIGLFSYSLYLWHLPIIHGNVPIFAGMPLIVAIGIAFLVAYLSYQLVERPFLRRRHRQAASEAVTAPALSQATTPLADEDRITTTV